MSVSGKVAIVTGAAQGLGKAFTQHLLKSGASVAMMDMKTENGQAACEELANAHGKDRVAFFQGNVTSQESFLGVFKSAKDRFGAVDIVINNAGVGGEGPGAWERTIDVNVNGTIRGTLLAFDFLRKDRGGRGGVVVNVASMAGLKPIPCSPAYCASKSAIIQYSRSWASHPELSANEVRVNVLAPAFVDTPMVAALKEGQQAMLPTMAKMIVDRAGVMTPEFVAEAVMELIDEEHGKNGAVLTVSKNGGKSYYTSDF